MPKLVFKMPKMVFNFYEMDPRSEWESKLGPPWWHPKMLITTSFQIQSTFSLIIKCLW